MTIQNKSQDYLEIMFLASSLLFRMIEFSKSPKLNAGTLFRPMVYEWFQLNAMEEATRTVSLATSIECL